MNRIRAIRKIVGLSMKELALASDVSQPYLHDLELGARGAKPETWERIAAALGTTVEQIKGKEDQQ